MILITSISKQRELYLIRSTFHDIMCFSRWGKEKLPDYIIILNPKLEVEKFYKYLSLYTDEQILKFHLPKKKHYKLYFQVLQLLRNNCVLINNKNDWKSALPKLKNYLKQGHQFNIIFPINDVFLPLITVSEKIFRFDYYRFTHRYNKPLKIDSLNEAANYKLFASNEYDVYFPDKVEFDTYLKYRDKFPPLQDEEYNNIPTIEVFENSLDINNSIKHFVFNNYRELFELVYLNYSLSKIVKVKLLKELLFDLLSFNYCILFPKKSLTNTSSDIEVYLNYMDLREKGYKIEEIKDIFEKKYEFKRDTPDNIIKDKFPQFKKNYGNIIIGILFENEAPEVGLKLWAKYSRYRSPLFFFINSETREREEQGEEYPQDIMMAFLRDNFIEEIKDIIKKYYPLLYKISADLNNIFAYNFVIDLIVFQYMNMKSTQNPKDALKEIQLLFGYIYLSLKGKEDIYKSLQIIYDLPLHSVKNKISRKLLKPADSNHVDPLNISSIFKIPA